MHLRSLPLAPLLAHSASGAHFGYVPRWRAIALRRRQATVFSDSMYDSAPAHVADLCARLPAHNGSPRADPDAHHDRPHAIPCDNDSPPYHCASILPHRLAPSPRPDTCPAARQVVRREACVRSP
ncbi:hypothetical protein C8R44DRAFT_775696 [Mycena epipterygia]|nr:hypothetical protein C8R44DRAFT_775696 [Mycena epipterygia]